jgi:hypothetical protein
MSVRIGDSFGDMRVILHGISQDNDLRDQSFRKVVGPEK